MFRARYQKTHKDIQLISHVSKLLSRTSISGIYVMITNIDLCVQHLVANSYVWGAKSCKQEPN